MGGVYSSHFASSNPLVDTPILKESGSEMSSALTLITKIYNGINYGDIIKESELFQSFGTRIGICPLRRCFLFAQSRSEPSRDSRRRFK